MRDLPAKLSLPNYCINCKLQVYCRYRTNSEGKLTIDLLATVLSSRRLSVIRIGRITSADIVTMAWRVVVNNVETRPPGGRGRPKDQHSGCPTCRLLISEEDVAPASRACARRAAELFVWVLLQPLFVVDYRMRSATCPTESVKRESMRLGRYSVSSGVELDRGLLIHITVCRHHLVDK